MNISPRLGFLLPVVLVAAILSGCSDDSGSTGPAPTGGQVMAIHASPDAPTVDLYVDGTKVASNVSYLMNTGYLNVAAGNRTVEVKLAGTNTSVYSIPAPVEAGKTYSVFAGGLVSGATFDFYAFEDTLETPPSGSANVRFIHMSPDAPAVDVKITGGATVAAGVDFGDDTGFASLPAGAYSFDVFVAGTTTRVLQVPNVTFQAGNIYTVFARGLVSVASGSTALGATVIVNR